MGEVCTGEQNTERRGDRAREKDLSDARRTEEINRASNPRHVSLSQNLFSKALKEESQISDGLDILDEHPHHGVLQATGTSGSR